MARNKFFVAAAPVLWATLASTAHAAQPLVDQPVPQGRATELHVGVDEHYDSNVARSDRVLAAKRGLTLADEITTPTVSLVVARPVGRTLFFVQGQGGYDLHRVNTVRDHANFAVGGGESGRFGLCQQNLGADYGLSQTDIAELASGVVNNVRENKDIRFAALCGRPTGLAPNVSVTQSWTGNSADRLKTIDSQSLTVEAGLAYRRPVLGSLALFGQHVDASYPNRVNLGSATAAAGGYEIFAGGLRYERHEGTRLDTTLSVSYTSLEPSSPSAPKFHGLTYSLEALYNLSSRMSVHASGVRATVPSNRIFANFKVDETYDADVSYKLGSKLTVKILGEIYKSAYSGGSLAARSSDLTHQTIYTATTSANYDLTKRITLNLSASDEERRANFPGLSYSSTKVTVGATVKFGNPT